MKSVASALAALAAAVPALAGGEGVPECACAATEFDFTINCNAATLKADLNASIEIMDSPACDTKEKCSFAYEDTTADDQCLRAWALLGAHHDYCPHDSLDGTEAENKYHVYYDRCLNDEGDRVPPCEILRKREAGIPDCPNVVGDLLEAGVCDAARAENAKTFLANNNCTTSCPKTTTSGDCGYWYQVVKSFHDECAGDSVRDPLGRIEAAVGTTLHDYEQKCEDGDNACNTASASFEDPSCTAPPPTPDNTIGNDAGRLLAPFAAIFLAIGAVFVH